MKTLPFEIFGFIVVALVINFVWGTPGKLIDWAGVSAVASTILTYALVRVGINQRAVMQKQSEHMAVTNALALQSFELNKKNIAADLQIIEAKIIFLNSESFYFYFNLINNGLSDAKIYKSFDASYVRTSLNELPEYDCEQAKPFHLTIGKGQKFYNISEPQKIPGNVTLELLDQKEKVLFILGFINYRDIFEAERTLKYGIYYDPEKEAPNMPAFIPNPGYNESV